MKKYIILISAALLSMTGCSFLDKTPLDKESAETYFKTENELMMFSNNFYSSSYTIAANDEPFQNQNDLIFQVAGFSAELRGGTNRVIPASGGGWSWSILRKINTLLDNIDKCPDVSAKEKYTAVARFFRAAFYFEKVKRFGDVPWIEHELGSDSQELYRPRDSRELIIDKVIDDLDYAADHLSDAVSTFRVNRWTALAFKSRICLYEGTWRKYHTEATQYKEHTPEYYLDLAAKAAELVMNSNLYSIATPAAKTDANYRDLFKAPDANQKEFIMAIHYDGALEVCHSRGFNAIQLAGQTISRKAVNMYLMKDGSRYTDQSGWQTKQFKEQIADRDPRLAQTIVNPAYRREGNKSGIQYPMFNFANTGYQSTKFLMDLGNASDNDKVASDGKSYNDIPVIRYAEVLLNYAEAKAEMGTLDQDDIKITINKIRERVGMPGLDMAAANANPCPYLSSAEFGYQNVSGANKGVILEIRRERAIELMQEGRSRWDDLMRWKEGKCIDQELLGMYFPGPGEYDLNGDGENDHCLYEGTKPDTACPVVLEIGKGIKLTDGNSGFVKVIPDEERAGFNENRDYLYPIPSNEITLSQGSLKQNPGWE